MDVFWRFVADIIASPVTNWNYAVRYESGEHFFIAFIAVVLVWLLPLIILACIIYAIVKKINWMIQREHCQHCQRWTIGPAGKTFTDCEAQKPCCADCYMEHEAAAEPRYECPVDGREMEKHINSLGCILDVCPSCGAVLVSGTELQVMLDDAEDDGRASGMLTGIAVGIAVN